MPNSYPVETMWVICGKKYSVKAVLCACIAGNRGGLPRDCVSVSGEWSSAGCVSCPSLHTLGPEDQGSY